MLSKKLAFRTGFTLLEIILVVVIVGVIAVFAISMTSSVRNAAKTGDTKNRMEEVAAKAKSFYRNSERLPDPDGTTGGVPVAMADLNLEAKYRYDAWGTPLEYHPGGAASPYNDIKYFTVDGNVCAGVIISLGPNQALDYTSTGAPATVYTTGGDDILVPVDVSQQAVEIALGELKELQTKALAFDAMYVGVDNDGNGTIDESGCVQIAGTDCPNGTAATTDPNCGTATLDIIDTATTFDACPTVPGGGALEFMLSLYSMADKYRNDPWGNTYVWGDGAAYTVSNARYHKFFSMGPNEASTPGNANENDDIIP